MKVTRLHVEAFRNLSGFSIVPCEGPNIICGNNAQGKTNLLEAIWLFTGERSFRGSRERDFIPHAGELAGLEFEFYAAGRVQTASLRWTENKRQILLNGVKQSTASAFRGNFCGVVFSPDHLSLVKDGPEGRRQMMDTSLSQAYPKYAQALLSYNKVLRQRNALLKNKSYNPHFSEVLSLWDDHIVRYGGYITALRDRYIRMLAVHAREFYQGISGGKENFSINYEPSFGVKNTDGYNFSDFRQEIRDALERKNDEDLRFGITSIGPHRDDLDIKIDGLSARAFGSQGQQRSSILALKLGECSILEEQTGESPVVMLDDVMSELDKHRRNFLLNKLQGKQVFITCCDTGAFTALQHGKIFSMKQGVLTQEKEKLPCPLPENDKHTAKKEVQGKEVATCTST